MAAYCPDAGDIIWLDFLQSVANEQAGRRPALVLSPRAFNELTGRCIAWEPPSPMPDDTHYSPWSALPGRMIWMPPISQLPPMRILISGTHRMGRA